MITRQQPRPLPGTVTTRISQVRICARCGFMLEGSWCDYECDLDGTDHTGNTITATYETTNKFIKDERT